MPLLAEAGRRGDTERALLLVIGHWCLVISTGLRERGRAAVGFSHLYGVTPCWPPCRAFVTRSFVTRVPGASEPAAGSGTPYPACLHYRRVRFSGTNTSSGCS